MILESLPLIRLHFEMESLETREVPPYKGDLLRMALLWWLSTFWCPEDRRCRDSCRRPDVCMFGRLCQLAINPNWSSPIRHLLGDTPPPAYTIWDLRDRRTLMTRGATWAFELVWVGATALQQLPAIVAAVQRGAEQGMGRIRWCNRVTRVTAWQPQETTARDLAVTEIYRGAEGLIWKAKQVTDLGVTYADAARWTAQWTAPVSTLQLDYLSPVKLKERGVWVETPSFSAVARALVRRLRILSEVYGVGVWPREDYGPLLDLADTVRLVHHETYWADYTRYSRQSGHYQVEGFLGPAWYTTEDFRPILPILWLGQWLHIGKSYVIGSGRYQLQINESRLT